MRRFRRLILVVIAVIVVALGYIYRRNVADQNTNEPPPPPKSDKKFRAQHYEWTKSEGTRTIVHVIAQSFAQVGETDKYDLNDVELHLFHKDGKAFDQVKSKKAQFDQMSGILFSDGDVEIIMGVPDEEKPVPTGKLLTIRSSGVQYDSKNGKATTDRAASFTFDRGDGQSTGAQYDPTTSELVMQKDVVLHWKAQTPKQKDMEVQAGNLVYKEKESKVYLSPWSKLKRDVLNVEGGDTVVTLNQGAIQKIDSEKAHGTDKDVNRQLDFAADHLHMDFDDDTGSVKGVTGEQNAKLISTSAETQMTVTSNRVDMTFDSSTSESRLQTARGTGSSYVESKPVVRANVLTPDTRILRSDNIILTMEPDGKNMKQVLTTTPGSVEFLPNRAGQKHRTMTADRLTMDYGPENRLQTFRASTLTNPVATRTDNPPAKGKPSPPALTWSKDLQADFDPKTGQMVKLDQWNDFRYEEGDRKAQSDRGSFDYAKNMVNLDGPASRVWDPSGSTIADKIVMSQQTGDVEAIGNVSSVREPDKNKKKPGGEGMLSSEEPVQAKSLRMTSTHSNQFVRYIGNAMLWQGSNRLQGDTVEIDRDTDKIAAHGNVISQFVDKGDPGRKTSASPKAAGASSSSVATSNARPVFTIIKAPDMVYQDRDKVAHYTGGVVLNRPGMVVESRELKAFLKTTNGSDSNLDKAFADGGVKIIQKSPERSRVGISEHAEYYVTDGKVILTGGHPQVVDSRKGTTRGTQLTYFSTNDRLLVDGVESQPAVSNIQRK